MTTKAIDTARIVTSIAVALTACATSSPPPASASAPVAATVTCKESNSCKGKATCTGVAAGEKHGCGSTNKCAGNVREITKDECDKIKGTVVATK
jgi:hypothetical protein